MEVKKMEQILGKIIKNAQEKQFLQKISTPEGLMKYFISEIIAPIAKEVMNINPSFYGVDKRSDETEIRVVDKKILIKRKDNTLLFCQEIDNSWVVVRTVYFDNEIPELNINGERYKVTKPLLEEMVGICLV